MSSVIFETPRLICRQIGADDLDEMLRVYGDRDAMKWVGDGAALTREEAVEWLELTERNYRVRGYGMCVLLARETGEVLGFCGLVHPDGQHEPEIKYAFKRAHWGQGYATEAVRAMLDYAAQAKGLRRVIATTDPDNLASHKVLDKVGMARGGLRRGEDGRSTQVFEWHAAAPPHER